MCQFQQQRLKYSRFFFFCSLHRSSLCLICSSPKVDVPPSCQPQLRKILFPQQTSESGAIISSWHRKACRLTVYNPDLCHLNHYFSHWPILDNADKCGILNMSEDERRPWKTVKRCYAFSMETFMFFLSLTRHVNVEMREDQRYLFLLCYEDYWRSTSVQSFPQTNVETKQNRETAAVNKAVCGFILPFLPSAASSNGSFKNIPATHSWQKTNSLISWRMMFWFGFITNISILCVIYSTILAKLSTVVFFHHLND